jgi:hypothetical protein
MIDQRDRGLNAASVARIMQICGARLEDPMKTARYALIALLCIVAGPSTAAPIYNPATGHWYDIVDSGADGSWTNAESNAIALGGHLVTINDAAEQSWLEANFPELHPITGAIHWIGLTDRAIEGTWVWSSGEAVTFTWWHSGEPNNAPTPDGNGEDFAVINAGEGGRWNDWDHTRPGFYPVTGIAEFATNPVPEPGAFGLLVSGLAWILRGGRQAPGTLNSN